MTPHLWKFTLYWEVEKTQDLYKLNKWYVTGESELTVVHNIIQVSGI